MDDSATAVLAAFEGGTLDPASFHHRDHVRLAWAHLQRYPLALALDRFGAGLRRLAGSVGRPERYHETVTWAFMLIINERMERTGRERTWEEFARANPDLMTWRPSVLDRYYPADVLASDLARRVFLLPGASPEA